MEEISYHLPSFDGPLDLLLALIAKNKIDITDIPIALIFDQYMEYISANGLAYHYELDGCHGDCRGQWLVYLTSGGDIEREDSVGVVHWRQLAAMFGIPRFDYVFAGGMDLNPEQTPELLEGACALARRLAEDL